MQTITLNGFRLAYTRRGTGTPLLLIHGYPLDHTIWDEILPLLEKDFDIILPDLRGFGKSTTIKSQYTIDDLASDFVGLLDHLGIQKAVLAGHSMGGYVALALACQYPDRVSGLALISSQAAADSTDRKEGRYKTAADVDQQGVGIVADAMTSKLSVNARVQDFVHGVIENQHKDAIIGALKAMAEREDFTECLSSIKFPVVLIHGDSDALIPIDRAREIKIILPTAQLVELPGIGHMPMMEAQEKMVEALKLLK